MQENKIIFDKEPQREIKNLAMVVVGKLERSTKKKKKDSCEKFHVRIKECMIIWKPRVLRKNLISGLLKKHEIPFG